MTEVNTGYRPRRAFFPLHARRTRWAIAVCHRRAGKTVACINDLVDAAIACERPDPRFAYVAPFFSQAKDVAWEYLKRYTAPIPGCQANESELRVDLPGGRRIRLYGADNYERLRGIYLDGVVLDEFGDIDPRAWSEVIRPSLADRQGWAIFIGTPKGLNHFSEAWDAAGSKPEEWYCLRLRASESGILPAAELAAARRDMSEDQYEAEFECSFAASVVGSYFGKEMQAAETYGRICGVPYEPAHLVDTWWDLGMRDAMAIWFTQNVGREVHVIDYYEDSGAGFPFYKRVLEDRGYLYGTHNAPHDIAVRELGSGKSRIEVAASLGIRFSIVPNIDKADGIDAVRTFIPRCWFDRAKTQHGRQALVSYHKVWDERRKAFTREAQHDWCLVGDTEVLTRHGTYPIMHLPPVGEVLTLCGWKPYHSPRITRRSAPLVEVTFCDGLTVRCTPEHLFLTGEGWKYASSLLPGFEILSSLTFSRGISMAGFTARGRVRDTLLVAAGCFTGTFGKGLLAQSHQAAMSTTGMVTSTTLCWAISNAYQARSTYPSAGTTTRRIERSISPMMRAIGLLSGIAQKLGGFGTVGRRNARKAGPSGSASLACARGVVGFFSRLFGRTGTNSDTARTTARPRRIERVRPLAYLEDVWCLTVPGEESFSLSNGAVVHNSSNAADGFRYLAVGHKTARPPKARVEHPRSMQMGGGERAGWLGV